MATSLESLVDGALVHYSIDGLVGWAYVRGYEHPTGYIVVEPRHGSPKIRETMLHCIGRRASLLPLSRVLSIISPWRAWKVWRDTIPRRLVEVLESLPLRKLGLTGSTALGMRGATSDYDIIIVPEDLETLYRELVLLKKRGYIGQCQADRVLAKRVMRKDVGVDPKHILSSLVESCLYGIPYTLRILRRETGTPCEPLELKMVVLGRVMLKLRLEPEAPWEGIAVPARYRATPLARSTRWPSKLVVEAWRTRYTGLAPGEYIVRGLLRLSRDGVLVISPDLNGGVWRA